MVVLALVIAVYSKFLLNSILGPPRRGNKIAGYSLP